MLKRGSTVVAGLLLNAVVLSSLIVSHPTTAVACPDEPPKTLLQLYRSSETIYLARFAKMEKGELVEKEEYKAYPIKKYFDVATTLKGESKKMFVLEEEEYFYEDQPSQPEPNAELPAEVEISAEPTVEHAESEEEGEEYEGERPLKEGDTVLLFLKRDSEDKKKVVIADYADGVRKIDADDAKTYERRIRELNGIFAGKKADDAKVVDWLVRVAEDPVTRWDGTFELLQAFENAEYNEAQAEEEAKNEEAEPDENGRVIEEEQGEIVEEESEEVFDNAVYATLLTDGHKQRLSHLLMNREEATGALVKGDTELIDLVKRWGDGEVGRVLIEKVRSGAYEPQEVTRMMVSAAKMLNDKELAKFAEKYEEYSWGEADEEIYDESDTQPEAATPDAKTAEAKTDQPPPIEKNEAEKTDPKVPIEKKIGPKKPTYGQQRAMFSAKFLARADVIFAKQKAMAAKQQ